MKKALILILTMLFLSTLLWAAASDLTSYIRLYDASFSVDLASNAFLSHLEGSTYKDQKADNLRKTGYYYQSQELGVVGLSDTNKYDTELGDIVFTITPDNDWFYKLAGSDYRRPFGIDVFARGRLDTDVDLGSLRLGYQADVFYEPNSAPSIVISADKVRNYSSIWWDFVLVMDPEVDTVDDSTRFRGNDYFITASDRSYTADLTISINTVNGETVTKSIDFPIHLEGYYKASEVEKTTITASFAITRADEILQLDGAGQLLSKIKANPSVSADFTTVASYALSTSAVEWKTNNKPNETRKIRMFLSSSNDAKVSAGPFILKHEKDANAPILLFKAAMTSNTNGHAPESDNKTVVFDGTDTFTPKTQNADYTLPANYLEIDATTTKQKTSVWYASWVDTGTIGIALTGQILQNDVPVSATEWTNQGVYTLGGNTQALTKGEYKSTIFIHVVTF